MRFNPELYGVVEFFNQKESLLFQTRVLKHSPLTPLTLFTTPKKPQRVENGGSRVEIEPRVVEVRPNNHRLQRPSPEVEEEVGPRASITFFLQLSQRPKQRQQLLSPHALPLDPNFCRR